jgi:hypothetical protein
VLFSANVNFSKAALVLEDIDHWSPVDGPSDTKQRTNPKTKSMALNNEDLIVESVPLKSKGGQQVVTTSTAVSVEHIPSRTKVTCDSERSQRRNVDRAKEVLEFGINGVAIRDLCREFIFLLDIVEESDSGTEFKPNKISSCRALDGSRMNKILQQLKQLTS